MLRECLMITTNSFSYPTRARTESFDTMGEIGVDPRWEVFADLHLYLNKAFPAVYAIILTTA